MSGGTTGTPVSTPTTGVEPILLGEAALNVRAFSDGAGSYFEAARITKLIVAARVACENYLEMSLVLKTLQVTQESFYPACIELPNGPVRSIVSVTYVDSNGDDVVLAADQYRLSTSSRMAVLRPAYGVTLPSARCETDSVRVRYIAGYPSADVTPEEVPETIRQAMHLYIAHWFVNREAVDVDGLMELPLGARFLLDQDRHGLGV